MKVALFLALLLALPALGHGYATKDLPPERVAISLTYNGEDIPISGEAPRDADIYVKVSSGAGREDRAEREGEGGLDDHPEGCGGRHARDAS